MRIVAVTKTVAVERLRCALRPASTTFGENRVQEAEAKAADADGRALGAGRPPAIEQGGTAVELFDAIHSVDSLELAERISRLAARRGHAPYPVYLQVNVDADPAKAGFVGRRARCALRRDSRRSPGLELRGLMTVGRLIARADEARPTFRALRELGQRLADHRNPRFGRRAVDGHERRLRDRGRGGCHRVRIGRALFGERPPG